MKHIVFFMHGVGKQKVGWSKELTQNFAANAKKIMESQNPPLTPQFELVFEELFYSNLLDANMKKMIDGGEGLGEINDFLKLGLEERNNADYVPNSTKEKIAAGIRDYAMDVVAYALNVEYLNLVLLELADRVVEVIKHNKEASFSFVSHSLGTKVSFDLLHYLYKGGPYSVDAQGLPNIGSPSFLSYYQLASVSQVIGHYASHVQMPNNSYIRATKLNEMPQRFGVISDSFQIVSNQYDIIAVIGEAKDINSVNYNKLTTIDYIDRPWMHDLSCYLDYPATHLQMIEDFYGVGFDEDFKNEVIKKYQLDEPNISDEIKQEIQTIIEMVKNGVDVTTLTQFILVLIDIVKHLREE